MVNYVLYSDRIKGANMAWLLWGISWKSIVAVSRRPFRPGLLRAFLMVLQMGYHREANAPLPTNISEGKR